MAEKFRKIVNRLALTGMLAAAAETHASDNSIAIESQLKMTSSYTTQQGDQLAGESFQPSLTISHKKGYSLSFWANLPVERINGLKTEEFDIDAGKRTNVLGLNLDTNLGFYTAELDFNGEKTRANIFHPSVSVSKSFKSSIGTTTPSAELNADLFDDGRKNMNWKLNIHHAFPKILGTNPNLRAGLFQRDGDIPAGDGAKIGADIFIPVTKNSQIGISVDKYFVEPENPTVGQIIFRYELK